MSRRSPRERSPRGGRGEETGFFAAPTRHRRQGPFALGNDTQTKETHQLEVPAKGIASLAGASSWCNRLRAGEPASLPRLTAEVGPQGIEHFPGGVLDTKGVQRLQRRDRVRARFV